ncbi:MAG: hypothetical protein ACLPKI_04825 [Streptosporangiaceae bacterium]
MGYYVVNAMNSCGKVTSRTTHLMQSSSPDTPGHPPALIAGTLLAVGSRPKGTLCGLLAGRHMDVFQPAEASCRECRKRYGLALVKEAALTPRQRAGRARAEAKEASRQETAQAFGWLVFFVVVVFLIVWIVVLHH